MNELAKLKTAVLEDVCRALDGLEEEFARFVEVLSASRAVYVIGAGRSLCVARAFAFRLSHCGLKAYASGDVSMPPARPGDVAVACSATGETAGVLCKAETARSVGCMLAAVTSSPESSLAGRADIPLVVRLSAEPACRQPLGSLFEQSAFILLDCAVMALMKKLSVSERDIAGRHCNLE